MKDFKFAVQTQATMRVSCVLALQAGSFLWLSTQAVAQDEWKELQKSTPVTSCRVSWKSVLHIKPNPQTNPGKRAAAMKETALQQGFTAEQAQKMAQDERQEAQNAINGQTVVSLLDFVRIGTVVRSNITYPELGHDAIEFSDGTNSLFTWTRLSNKAVAKDANLTRAPKDVLSRSTGGEQIARFLLAIPLGEQFSTKNFAFSPANTTVSNTADGNILLEPKFSSLPQQQNSPSVLTLSKAHDLPTTYEIFGVKLIIHATGMTRAKGKLQRRIDISGYQQYKNGIWFPSKITVTEPHSTTEYTLLKAAFNEDVDPMELRLPADIRVADARFGAGSKLATYQLKNGVIPTDDEVRQKLGLDKEAAAAKDSAVKATKTASPQPAAPTSPAAPLAGLLFMAVGGAMWVRSRKDEQS